MIEEMDTLDDNGISDLVQLPVGKKAIRCYWVFVAKVNFDPLVTRFNAHLVSKGYV